MSLDTSYILVGGGSSDSKQPDISDSSHPSTSSSYTPGSSRSYAHDWSDIRISGRHFVDKYGRVCHLRGVNLSGSSKTPANDNNETFPADAEIATFVGRPFPLEEAHEHFSRLRRWGFTFIRFLVTWEAVEHAGPGIYDTDYLKYIRDLLQLLPKYGMVAFVSLHQDVWSRYSGGSGAPAWTLESVGFDLNELVSTGAAWLNGVKGGGHTEDEMGFWSTGYQKLAASTMATVFWAGETFTPKLTVEYRRQTMNVQEFLQTTYLDMFDQVVKAVGDLDGVIGFEMMNEPHRGYIDLKSLHSFDYNTDLHLGPIPSAFQSFQLGAGYPTTVDVWKRSFPLPTRKSHKVVLNPEGKSVWKGKAKQGDGEESKGQCIWEMHGVWGWSKDKKEAVVLRENYFVKHPMTGNKIDWYTDIFCPFLNQWANRVHAISPSKMVFIEVIPNEFCPPSFLKEVRPKNMVYAPHWYDLKALFEKAYGDFTVNVQGLSRGMSPLLAFYWGHKGARKNYAHQISTIVYHGLKHLGEVPIVIGECGVPMDMNNREAFETEDFTWQARMMDAMMTGLEKALVPFTLWNYNPYNTDSEGDFWNGENFSWFSRGRALPAALLDYHQSSATLDNGGRILNVIVRPYPGKTAGIPGKFEYEVTTGRIVYEWKDDGLSSSTLKDDLKAKETEFFIPSMLTYGRKVLVSGLEGEDRYIHDEERQTLFIVTKNTGNHRVEIGISSPPRPIFFVNDFWSDWGGVVAAIVVLFVAVLVGVIALYFRV